MFDVVNFIEMVREQRCLWDKSSEGYYNKTLTMFAWICVAKRLYHDFQNVSLETTGERGKILECFLRMLIDLSLCTGSFVKLFEILAQ